jgi:TolB-like protein/class 3 adenylate cyclase/cytochrome c-type biogenesis protein CcmH/NrfG
MPPVRRLTAILAADVAGYSRLMGADEEGTHERLRAHLRELVNPNIEEHRGRIVKNTGDGFLAEFPSVVDAVRCAVEVQRGMIERNTGTPTERRIEFRVGINLGDVIAEEDDLFGDGVNVAARLEALAEPGGICISGTVRDHIGDRLPYAYKDKGEQRVKNIARPVRVLALRPDTIAGLAMTDAPISVPRRRHSNVAPVAAAVAALLVLAAIAWWVWPAPRRPSTPPTTVATAATTPIAQPLVAPRLSIVVLPFANLSNDPDQQYFADGITEDLTTDLSRITDMFVISRNTAFTYKNKSIDAKQIGRELGVRFVLEGSLRRSGNQVRINTQLIDAETNAHLWAERFDRDAGDLFALQNEITGRIAGSLNLELPIAEAARAIEHPDALDYVLRGRATLSRGPTRENYAEAIGLYERALAVDPRSVDAQSRLALAFVGRVLDGRTDFRDADIERAAVLIEQVLTIAPRNLVAHQAKGQLLLVERRCAEAIREYETVLTYNHNLVYALSSLAVCKFVTGSEDEPIPILEQAIRLSPRDPGIGILYARVGFVHLLQSRTDEAIVWLEKARSANSQLIGPPTFLASAYGLKGDLERAGAELREVRKLSGNDRFSSIAGMRATSMFNVPALRTPFENILVAGLRKAGMPEE